MMKATLFTAIVGLASAKLPVVAGLAGVAATVILEICALALSQGHSPLHYGGGLAALYVTGEACLIAGLLWLR